VNVQRSRGKILFDFDVLPFEKGKQLVEQLKFIYSSKALMSIIICFDFEKHTK